MGPEMPQTRIDPRTGRPFIDGARPAPLPQPMQTPAATTGVRG